MHDVLLLAQEATELPETGGSGFFTILLLAGGTLALWLMIRNTKKKANRHFMDRQQREADERRNDPDLARPDDDEG
jgi:LPXTG-motif cell wall-anchored protein